MSDELEHIWSRVQAELAQAVGEPTYRIWLEDLRPFELTGERLRVETPPQARGWIEARFGRVIQSCVATVIGPGVTIELVGGERTGDPLRALRPKRSVASIARARPTRRVDQAIDPSQNDATPRSGPLGNPKLSFDQFVIGDSNRLAHAAALTVAEMPAQAYNPLFICGPPGSRQDPPAELDRNPAARPQPGADRALHDRRGVHQRVPRRAIQTGAPTDSRQAFAHLDVLLVDDVQFLERKAKTEEEFFHTFNALYDAGRQIVLSSDRPPRDLQALEDRLRERFEAGLVADIEPPELATRLAILRKRAHHDGIEPADPQVLQAIAERVTLNVRALEGALIRVVAFSSLTGRELTVELAREVLDGLYPASERFERAKAEVRRRDPGGRRRALRHLLRGAALDRTHRTHRLAAAGGDVPRARAHRRVPTGDR